MGICAYCDIDKKLTKEHLIPSWYIKEDASPSKNFFLERVDTKFIKSDPQVKDVCAECNNLKLGALDQYAKGLYFKSFLKDAYSGEKTSFSFDYDVFVRWLLKVSFNCARIHCSDIEILSGYSKEMIGEEPLSNEVIVFSMAVSPSYTGEFPSRRAKRNEYLNSVPPRWFRIGAFRIADKYWFNWTFRHVFINGYSFFLAVPKKGVALGDERKQILVGMRQNGFGTLLSPKRPAHLKSPSRHAIEFFAEHVEHFPTAYNLPEHKYISDIVKSKYEVINYFIDKLDVESGDIRSSVEYIDALLRTRESIMACHGKVEFSISGYDEDSRELWEIPEVRYYLSLLNDARPYWFLFQSRKGGWLKALTLCLIDVKKVPNGTEALNPEKVPELIAQWYAGLNKVSNDFALSGEINSKLSMSPDYFIEMIRGES